MSDPGAASSTTDRQASRLVRVAVVQLAYLPAFQDSQDYLSEPVSHPERAVSCLLPEGVQAAPQPILQPYKELRRRLRATYVKHLKRRVVEVLKACQRWEVKLVVFPEYSIPPEILSDIADAAPEIVVVAGSHFVSDDVIDAGYYEKLGLPRDEELFESAVSPVIYGGKISALVKKIHPAKPELRVIKPSQDWTPVILPDSIPGPMAVLICLDFLARGTKEHWERIASQLRDCRFIATPALSPKHTLDEFMNAAYVDARRDELKKPVLLANDAQHGGSTLIVDEGRIADNRLFPEHAGLLEAGEEGIIVANIDLGFRSAGGSTSYQITPVIEPFAAASFVYRGTEPKYAQWLDSVTAILDEKGASRLQKLKTYKAFVSDHAPEIPKKDSARQRRISRLLESAPNVERVQQWTREVILPEDILPLSVLRASLARGAADVLKQWQDEKNLGEFGPVVTRLRAAWDKEKKDEWTPTLLATATAVQHEVAGDAKQKSSQMHWVKAIAYDRMVGKQFEDALREAVAYLQKEDFAEGKQRLERIAADISAEITRNGSSDELLQQRARCQMYIGSATLNLQEMAKAREILLGVELSRLTEKARLQLIGALVVVGEVERAKVLLPAKENVSEELLPTWGEAQQSLMLADGIVPDPLLPDEGLRLFAANVYLKRNNDEMAARLAIEVLRSEKQGALTRAIATHTLCAALMRTVHDWPITPHPPPIRIECKLEIREPIVQQLEGSFRDLRNAPLPDAIRKHLSKLERGFRAWTKDYDALATYDADALDDFEEDEPSHPNFADRDRAFELVRKGDVDEALRILPPNPHPWRRRADEVELLAHGQRFELALEKAIALQKDFPDRPRIESALAELYAIARNHPEALKHAERAFVALPGIGYRLQLVQSRINTGDGNGAFELLQGHLEDERPLVQRAIAATAMVTERLPVAEQAWKRYAQKKPDDWMGLMNLAEVQFRLHRLEDAAKTSHDAFVRCGDELPADALYRCGVFQASGLTVESERESGIKAIAKKLHDRFPKDAQAEEYRFQLLAKLGEIPADADPIDFNALVAKGTMFRGYGFSTLIEHFKARNEFLRVVWDAAQKGAMPISKFLPLANNDPARFLTRLLDGFGPSEGWLCPPISLADEPPAAQLQGATILLGHLELLLLLKLNLLEPLQKELGPNGDFALFPHVKQQILDDATDLRTRASRVKLDVVEALIRKLEHWPEAKRDENVPVVDWPESEDDDPELRPRKNRPVVHIHAYLRFLKQNGVLAPDELAGLEQLLGLRDEPDAVLSEPLPERIGFTFVVVEKLDRVGVLEKVLREFHSQIVLVSGTLEHFRDERNDLRVILAAAELADKAFEVVAGERMRVVPIPRVGEVPPLRSDVSVHYEKIVREPLQEVVAYRHAVLDCANCWHLTVEYLGTTGLGTLDFVKMLAWTDADHYKNVVTLVRQGAARGITFPSLVRYLARSEKEADTKLRSLASLGFADALGPGELLRLDKQYEGLAGAEPKRLLQAMEWMARHPQHLAGDYARLRIAHTYGAAVFNAYSATDRSEQEQFRVVEQLFGRLERLGEETKTDPLDTAFTFLAGRTADHWQDAWTPVEDTPEMFMDVDAPIQRLWRAIHSWCQVNFVRRAALGRATRTIWSMLSARAGGPPAAVAMTLSVIAPEQPDREKPKVAHQLPDREKPKELSLLEPADEVVAILSSLWNENPFSKTGYGDLVERSVAFFSRGVMGLQGGRSARVNATFSDSDTPIHVAIPMEALFLRFSRNDKERFVQHVQLAQGPFDGVMYGGLERIKDNPDDSEALRAYALYATNALFRLVQDDPSYLLRWQKAHWQDDQQISRLVFLLMIISEPNEPLPEGLSVSQILHDRVVKSEVPEKESGFWADRVDAPLLFGMAEEIPGVFPSAWLLRPRVKSTAYAEEVERALSTITDCEKHPIARVASEVYFLRVAASRRPYLERGGKKIDLRDELPSYLEGLLERVITDPPPDTMAFFEPALLRACGGVIQRLALPDHTPIREGIFWTYRLYQWLCLQLEAISPDARLDGMRRLAALAPPVNNPHDILDPFGFGRNDLDIRLATVLHTLAHLHILDIPEGVDETNLASRQPARVSTPKIEQRLLELAQKSHQGPTLGTVFQDWHFPGNVPDMALYTLLNVNSARFADMSEESRLRRFEAIPKNLEAIDKEHEGERLLWDLVLAAALNHAESLTPKERRLVETKIREMEESAQAARYRRGMVLAFFAAGEEQLEAEAFMRVLEDPTDPDFGSLLSALFLTVANRDPAGFEPVVRSMAQGLAEKGADVARWIGRGLARVVNMGKPEARKVTRALLLRLAKEKPFANNMDIRELLTTFNIRENNT